MMKKILALIISSSLLFSFTGCGNSNKNSDSAKATSSNSASEKKESSKDVSVDEGLLDVTITLPASMFENETNFDPKAYNEEQGFKETIVNEDGSISITMSKKKHNELMSDMKKSIDETFSEIIESEETPYIKKITSDKDFSTVTVEVDKAGYESAMLEMTPFLVGLSAMAYQQYNGTEIHCEILIKDVSTGDTLKTVVYPEDFNKN